MTDKAQGNSPTYRIGAVSRLTGVPADTLRVWERRYSVVTPYRAESGTRLYGPEDVGRLTLIKRLVDRGDAISSVANLTLARSIELHAAALGQQWRRALELRDWFEPLTDLRGQLGNAMLKGGLEMMGLAGGPIRDSGARLDAAGRRRVSRLLRAKGLL